VTHPIEDLQQWKAYLAQCTSARNTVGKGGLLAVIYCVGHLVMKHFTNK